MTDSGGPTMTRAGFDKIFGKKPPRLTPKQRAERDARAMFRKLKRRSKKSEK